MHAINVFKLSIFPFVVFLLLAKAIRMEKPAFIKAALEKDIPTMQSILSTDKDAVNAVEKETGNIYNATV
jgi:hypothetical protein